MAGPGGGVSTAMPTCFVEPSARIPAQRLPVRDDQVLPAYREDGARLDRPRLVVPGDVKGGRYVSDVPEVRSVGLP
jgi:hypothetical protein